MTPAASAQPLPARLKLRHLRLVLALGEQRSAARVAAQLHVSPAAVSKTLAEIEEIVGMALFERGRHGMQPTEVGLEVLQSATLINAQLQRMAESVQAARSGSRGRVTLSFRTLSVQPFLAQTVCAFQETHPLVSISVIEGAVHDMIEQLVSGELDLLFAYEDPRFDRPELASTPVVGGQKVVVIASRAHPLLRLPRITVKDLIEHQWCLPALGSRLQHHLDTSFRLRNSPSPSRGIRTSDMAMITHLLQTANFLAILPVRIASHMVAGNVARVLPFSLGSRVEPVVVLWNKLLQQRSSAKAFLDFAVQRAAETSMLSAQPSLGP